jgi:hypothetical protein
MSDLGFHRPSVSRRLIYLNLMSSKHTFAPTVLTSIPHSAGSDYIQLYNGDKETLMESLGQIQKTAAEILGAVMDKESEGDTVGGESCVAVAA